MENFRLKVFRAVAKHLNFRRAAEELCLTQPAVTLQVKTLEQQLGVLLFDRSGTRISLTPAGTMPTLNSLSFISFGTPIIMRAPPQFPRLYQNPSPAQSIFGEFFLCKRV